MLLLLLPCVVDLADQGYWHIHGPNDPQGHTGRIWFEASILRYESFSG